MIPCEFSSRFLEIQVSVQSTNRDRRVLRGGHELRPKTGFGLVGVLAECDIARVVRFIFDAPMASVEFEQSLGIGLFTSEIRDAIHGFGGRLPLASLAVSECSLKRDSKYLSDTSGLSENDLSFGLEI